jgi:hypothetical protein
MDTPTYLVLKAAPGYATVDEAIKAASLLAEKGVQAFIALVTHDVVATSTVTVTPVGSKIDLTNIGTAVVVVADPAVIVEPLVVK